MSYGWATNLVYRATGSQPPSQAQPAGVRLQESSTSHSDQNGAPQLRSADQAHSGKAALGRSDSPRPAGSALYHRLKKIRDRWSITMRPSPGKNITDTRDRCRGWRPSRPAFRPYAKPQYRRGYPLGAVLVLQRGPPAPNLVSLQPHWRSLRDPGPSVWQPWRPRALRCWHSAGWRCVGCDSVEETMPSVVRIDSTSPAMCAKHRFSVIR